MASLALVRRARLVALGASFALLLGATAPARAQGTPPGMTAEDKAAEFDRLFQFGLQALTQRKLKESEQAFLACVQLDPARPIPYYNLACAYSLMNDVDKACEQLRKSYALGYRDLSHMERDIDLDPIRKLPAYRKVCSDLEEEAVRGVESPRWREPDGEGEYPLLVYVHDQRATPDAAVGPLEETLSRWGILVPAGPLRQQGADSANYFWDGRAEFLVVRALREALAAHPRADRRRVFIVGEGDAGRIAVSIAAHHPDLFVGVLAAGSSLEVATDDVELSGLRAFLVVQPGEEEDSGRDARDAFAKASSPVVLERYPQPAPFLKDRAVLLRGLSWLQGEEVHLPGAGEAKHF